MRRVCSRPLDAALKVGAEEAVFALIEAAALLGGGRSQSKPPEAPHAGQLLAEQQGEQAGSGTPGYNGDHPESLDAQQAEAPPPEESRGRELAEARLRRRKEAY